MSVNSDRVRSKLLVLLYRRGNKDAFNELIRIWERPLFYYIRRLVKHEEDAWDVLQEVWITIIRKIGSLNELDALPTWLYRIARNAALMHLRKHKSLETFRETEDGSILEPAEPEPNFSLIDAETIHWGLEQLPTHQREVLILFFLEDFSIREIGSVINAAAGTVKSRLHYAKKALRDIFEKEGVSK